MARLGAGAIARGRGARRLCGAADPDSARESRAALPAFPARQEEPAPGILDIAWFDTHGEIISPDSWNDPQKRLFAVRRAAKNDDGRVAILTLFLNPSENDRVFRLPTQNVPTRLLIDSAAPDEEESDVT